MKLEILGHACARLTDRSGVLVVDPGTFSSPAALATADAVLVTHEHADHLDVGALLTALAERSHVEVWAPAAVVAALQARGVELQRLHEAVPGTALTVLGHDVDVVGGTHAAIHADLPRIANVGYVIDGAVLHPGDAFVDLPEGTRVHVALTPVSGPWLKLAEIVDWVRALQPAVVVPIHDALLSPIGRGSVLRQLGSEGLGAGWGWTVVDLADDGASLDVDPDPAARAALVAHELEFEHPEFGDVPTLERDENVAPRPEEEVADTDGRAD
jgi:L-ascorbate metabolism protein UlaG (beta-lactamase superfamily)